MENSSLYVSILNYDLSVQWYLINYQPNCCDKDGGGEFNISRVDELNKSKEMVWNRNYASVACNSKIYFLGGITSTLTEYPKPNNNVFVYNTVDRTLETIPPMRARRSSPVATILSNGEIYIFGNENLISLTHQHWAESYNPINRAWKFLRPPPKAVRRWNGSPDGIALHEPTFTIYIWKAFTGFFSYNYTEKKWADRGNYIPCAYSTAVVDNVLLWHFHDKIYAYDLLNYTMLPNPTDYPLNPRYSVDTNHLVHLGGDLLCYLTCTPDGVLKLDKFHFDLLRSHSNRGDTEVIYVGTQNTCIDQVLKLPCHDGENLVDKTGKMEITKKEDDKGAKTQIAKEEEDPVAMTEIAVKEEDQARNTVTKGNMQETFMLIYSHGVINCRIGGIIREFERKGFTLKELKLIEVDQAFAKEYYLLSGKQKSFMLKPYIKYLTFGPVVAMVWKGVNVISEVVKTVLSSDPWVIDTDDYPMEVHRDVIGYSDSEESARKNILLWFSQPMIHGHSLRFRNMIDGSDSVESARNKDISSFTDGPATVESGLHLIPRGMIDYNDPVESARNNNISWFPDGPTISGSILHGDPETKKMTYMSEWYKELAFFLIKQGGVVKGFVGEVIRIFEKKGFILKGLKLVDPLAKQSSSKGPVVAMIWQGKDVAEHIKKTIHAEGTDIFASWIYVEGRHVKVDSTMIHCGATEAIPNWFWIKERVGMDYDEIFDGLIFE